MSASRVGDFGIPPNWFGSITVSTAGAMWWWTTKSSASLERAGTREIGRRCLLTSVTGFCLGIGTTSAIFQEAGHLCSAKLQFKMDVTGWAMTISWIYRQALRTSYPCFVLRILDRSCRLLVFLSALAQERHPATKSSHRVTDANRDSNVFCFCNKLIFTQPGWPGDIKDNSDSLFPVSKFLVL